MTIPKEVQYLKDCIANRQEVAEYILKMVAEFKAAHFGREIEPSKLLETLDAIERNATLIARQLHDYSGQKEENQGAENEAAK